MLILLTLLAFFLIYLRLFVFKSRSRVLYEKFPGPRCLPIIGSLLEFDYPKVEVTETLKLMSFKYGPVYKVNFGMESVICLRNPTDIETILSSNVLINKADLYWPLLPWLNQGLLTSGGDKWRKHRKIITPAFHFKVLEKFVPVFVKDANILVDKLFKTVGKEVDIMQYVALCSLDIIYETAMGLDVQAQLTDSKYVNSVNELQEIMAHRNFDLIERTFLFNFLASGRRHNELIAYLHRITEEIMKDRKVKLQEATSEKIENDDIDIGIREKKAFLDLLLEFNMDGAGMTDAEIRDEVDTFMFEGYDTTTSTMSFCLYCLSQNSKEQEKAYEEQKQIFGDSERDATFQDLQEMKYLERCVRESLRRYPTVQFIGRRALKEIELNSGYIIPEGASIIVLIQAMNLDPELYQDPLRFDPDRFDNHNKNSHPYSFVPFSAGPRNCIGQKYAMLELKCVLSRILRSFRLLPSKHPITEWFNIVMKSKTGIYLQCEPRKKV